MPLHMLFPVPRKLFLSSSPVLSTHPEAPTGNVTSSGELSLISEWIKSPVRVFHVLRASLGWPLFPLRCHVPVRGYPIPACLSPTQVDCELPDGRPCLPCSVPTPVKALHTIMLKGWMGE